MSYIIGKPCDGVCDTACVDVCPVDCINGPIDIAGRGQEIDGMSKEDIQGKQLYINPEECIDCTACVSECPVEAIYEDEDVPNKWKSFIKKNYDFFDIDMD